MPSWDLSPRDPDHNVIPIFDSNPATVESEPGTKKKKGKNGKGKAKPTVRSVEEEMIQCPLSEEPIPDAGVRFEPEKRPSPETAPNLSQRPQIVSPVLEALGSLGVNADNEKEYRTDAWAKSIPVGKSPPSLLDAIPDGGFASGSPFSLPNYPERIGGFSNLSSTSPPSAHARPFSYGNGYVSIPTSRHQSRDRQTRHSIGAQLHNQPPLPHLPQPHFYGAPEVDIQSLSPRLGPTTEKHYSFCAFDTIGWHSTKATRVVGKVLLVGTDGALEVLMIENHKTRIIGKLEGLCGRVVNAKLIPRSFPADLLANSHPLVAIVIHGPMTLREDGLGTSSAGSEPIDGFSGLSGRQKPHETNQPSKDEAIHYQTRVEIYSLKTGELVSTLFKGNPVPGIDGFPNLNRFAPSPQGNLKILVSDTYITIVSGVTGEVYVYSASSSTSTVHYQCIAKTWTSILSRETRRYSNSSNSTDQDNSQMEPPNGSHSFDLPLISLSGRWLAVVPPSSSMKAPPLGSVPPQLLHRKIHGLETHIPPAKPSVNCATDSGEGESLFDRVARGVTQEVIRGARWMGDQGLQAWNNYWNRDQQSTAGTASRRISTYLEPAQHSHNSGAFPPTHAQDAMGSSPLSDSDSISLFDLRKLEENSQETRLTFPTPIATFQVPNGCGFLSLSPNGLMLLTASKKGDVQYVWDLMQIKYCRALEFMSEEPSSNAPLIAVNPLVRQISRYARLTTSSIVDVVWTEPTGERFAILTRKGTVHTFDLARTAFQWPPLRRVRPKMRQVATDDPTIDPQSEESASGNPFSAAIKLVGERTQPILAAVRNRAPSTGQTFSGVAGFGISSVASARGGKVVAAGLSKSVGAATGTVSNLRHVGENRLHLTGFARDPVSSRVAWISIKDECLLAVVDSGYFRIFKVNRSTSSDKTKRGNQPVIGAKMMEVTLPLYLQNPSGPLHLTSVVDASPSALWTMPSSAVQPLTVSKLQSLPLSQAEIETNAPYQPFHTDRRVSLWTYCPGVASPTSHGPESKPWVFGNEIVMTKLHVWSFNQSEDEDSLGQAARSNDMENLISLGNSTNNIEEVVITTRRKKRQTQAGSGQFTRTNEEDGFFEDDCDVLDFARDRV